MKKLLAMALALVMALGVTTMAWADVTIYSVGTMDELLTALEAANDGDTIKLTENIAYAENGTGLINITKSIILDGAGHSITGYGIRGNNYAKNVIVINNSSTDMVDVTIKNLVINCTANSEEGFYAKAIETRGNIAKLTLDGCKINCTGSGNVMAVNVGGNQSVAAEIVVIRSTISVGQAGYPFNLYNPVKITIEESTINGYCGIYFRQADNSAGSAGSIVNASKSGFNCPNVHNGESSNDFAVFATEDRDITINLTDCEINASATGTAHQAVIGTVKDAEGTIGASAGENCTTTISGDKTNVNGTITVANDVVGNVSIKGGAFTVDVSEYAPEGTPVASVGNEGYIVGSSAIAAAANGGKDVTVVKAGAISGVDSGVTIKATVDGVTVNNVAVPKGDAGYTVPTPPRYYYNSTTTTDTKADGTKGSPKTFDAGVGIYAVSAVLSLTGMAYVGKRKF